MFDVHVVSESQLTTSGVPSQMPSISSIRVSGVVFEDTPEGRQPIGGATVALEGDPFDARIGSTTRTDAAGRYLVCPSKPSTGTDQFGLVHVRRDNYRPASKSAFPGWDYSEFDIELIRNQERAARTLRSAPLSTPR